MSADALPDTLLIVLAGEVLAKGLLFVTAVPV